MFQDSSQMMTGCVPAPVISSYYDETLGSIVQIDNIHTPIVLPPPRVEDSSALSASNCDLPYRQNAILGCPLFHPSPSI